jgi:hypothetical protein
MAIKVENLSNIKLPKQTLPRVDKILESLPREHLRGIEKVRLVNRIIDPRLKALEQKTNLPGLYHPRQGPQQAWLEIAVEVLLPQDKPRYKRLMPLLSFKGNLAAIIFSLVGQHYYLTLRHSIKRGQLESVVRQYTEKQLREWQQQQGGMRARLFKPFQPRIEKWGRALQKRAAEQKKKSDALRS